MPYDIVAPTVVKDPHSFFRRLREHDPIHWAPRHRAWIVTRYDDVEAACRDERLSSDNIRPLQERMSPEEKARYRSTAELLSSWMIFNDPLIQTALRAPVRAGFKPRAIEDLRSQLEAVVDQLLAFLQRPGGSLRSAPR